MMSDGEYYLVSEPVPVGKRNGYTPKKEGNVGYERVFDLIAKGATVMPLSARFRLINSDR